MESEVVYEHCHTPLQLTLSLWVSEPLGDTQDQGYVQVPSGCLPSTFYTTPNIQSIQVGSTPKFSIRVEYKNLDLLSNKV